MVQGTPAASAMRGDLLRRPDAAVLAGIKAQHVGGPGTDDLQGILRREDAFVGHDRDAAATPHLGHGGVVAAARRLLEQGHVQLLQTRRRPDGLLDRVAAVGIDRQPDVGPDGLAHGRAGVPRRRGMSSRPTLTLIARQPRSTMRRARWAASSGSTAPTTNFRRMPGSAPRPTSPPGRGEMPGPPAEQLVDRHAEGLPLQIEQGHLQGPLGEAVAEGDPLQAVRDPFHVERVGPDEQRGQLLARSGRWCRPAFRRSRRW